MIPFFMLILSALVPCSSGTLNDFHLPPMPLACFPWNLTVSEVFWVGGSQVFNIPAPQFHPGIPSTFNFGGKYMVKVYRLGVGKFPQELFSYLASSYPNPRANPKVFANTTLATYLDRRLGDCAVAALNAAWRSPDNGHVTLAAFRANADPAKPVLPDECKAEVRDVALVFTQGMMALNGIPQYQAFTAGSKPAFAESLDSKNFPLSVKLEVHGRTYHSDAREVLESYCYSRVLGCALAVFDNLRRIEAGNGGANSASPVPDESQSHSGALVAVLITLIVGEVVAWLAFLAYKAKYVRGREGAESHSLN